METQDMVMETQVEDISVDKTWNNGIFQDYPKSISQSDLIRENYPMQFPLVSKYCITRIRGAEYSELRSRIVSDIRRNSLYGNEWKEGIDAYLANALSDWHLYRSGISLSELESNYDKDRKPNKKKERKQSIPLSYQEWEVLPERFRVIQYETDWENAIIEDKELTDMRYEQIWENAIADYDNIEYWEYQIAVWRGLRQKLSFEELNARDYKNL
jgi:hypothetical protein